MFISTGGNTCVQCKVRMRKGLPYVSPVKGKFKVHQLKGKSLCIACLLELYNNAQGLLKECDDKELDLFQSKRFLEHLDKDG